MVRTSPRVLIRFSDPDNIYYVSNVFIKKNNRCDVILLKIKFSYQSLLLLPVQKSEKHTRTPKTKNKQLESSENQNKYEQSEVQKT